MERLTHKARYEAGYKLNKNVHEWEGVDKLAAYENTGLTPKEIIDGKMLTGWIPVEEQLPKNEDYVLMSFENFSLPMVGRYERDEDGGGSWYLGDCDEDDTCVANDLFVNAWQPLPKPYRETAKE